MFNLRSENMYCNVICDTCGNAIACGYIDQINKEKFFICSQCGAIHENPNYIGN